MAEISASPAMERTAVHPSITPGQISELVDRFYGDVRANARLGPIFDRELDGRWDAHLDKMKAFWRSVLLRTGEYRGQPVSAHLRISDIVTDDFGEWLSLFAAVSGKVFHPEAAPLVDEAARRIATSLWLSRSRDPFASPPQWSHGGPSQPGA
ncbi:MAG: group III truncated hemoglobin [Rhizobiaceae bacterium]